MTAVPQVERPEPRRAVITETLLRDGLQMEDRIVTTEAKLEIARGLIAAGFPALEIGAFVHPDRVPQMADTDELLRELLRETSIPLHTLVFNTRGAERALAAGARHVRLVISASEGHSRANSGVPIADALTRLREAAGLLRDAGVELEAGIATSFICPFDGITPPSAVVRIIDELRRAGVGRIGIADTIGNAVPAQITETVTAIRRAHPDQDLSIHLHDTYNLGIANAWAAWRAGIDHFDAALGGLGGCPFAPGAAGNIGSDDLVHLLHRSGIPTGVDPEHLGPLRDRIADAVGHALASAHATIPATPSVLIDGPGA